jgi:hypothetical protein
MAMQRSHVVFPPFPRSQSAKLTVLRAEQQLLHWVLQPDVTFVGADGTADVVEVTRERGRRGRGALLFLSSLPSSRADLSCLSETPSSFLCLYTASTIVTWGAVAS